MGCYDESCVWCVCVYKVKPACLLHVDHRDIPYHMLHDLVSMIHAKIYSA